MRDWSEGGEPASLRFGHMRFLRRIHVGAAGRIMIANSVMLVGILLLTTTLLYTQLSTSDARDEQTALRSIAVTAASALAAERQDSDAAVQMIADMRRSSSLSTLTVLSPSQLPQRVRDGQTDSTFRDDPSGGEMRVIAPILRAGEVIGGVEAGKSGKATRESFAGDGGWIVAYGSITGVLGILATWMTSRGLRRATGNYGTEELGKMIGYYQSVLQSVSEGLLLFDRGRGQALYNSEAAQLLRLPQQRTLDFVAISELLAALPKELREPLSQGTPLDDEFVYTDDRVLVVNQQPTNGSDGTWVTTMRDHTELQELSGELVSLRSFSDSLRSQTHEFANRMHIIASLIETGQHAEALDFATREMALMDRPSHNVLGGFDNPVVSALVLTKLTQAHEAGIELHVDTAELTGALHADERDLVTIVGNLLDNAFDAVSLPGVNPDRRRVTLRMGGSESSGFTIDVEDDGLGIAEEDLDCVFLRGWSTKHDGDQGSSAGHRGASRGVGLAIVVQAVRRLGGAIDVRGEAEESGDPLGAAFTVWLPGNTRSRSVT